MFVAREPQLGLGLGLGLALGLGSYIGRDHNQAWLHRGVRKEREGIILNVSTAKGTLPSLSVPSCLCLSSTTPSTDTPAAVAGGVTARCFILITGMDPIGPFGRQLQAPPSSDDITPGKFKV